MTRDITDVTRELDEAVEELGRVEDNIQGFRDDIEDSEYQLCMEEGVHEDLAIQIDDLREELNGLENFNDPDQLILE